MGINIEDSKDNFITWSERSYLSKELKDSILKSDILIVPVENFRDLKNPVFPQRTEEFYKFLKEEIPSNLSIEVCIEDEDYKEFALYDDSINIGYFVLTNVVLALFLNILSNYIYKKVFDKDQENNVKFTITVVNETESRTIVFEGNANELRSAVEEIKILCLEKGSKSRLSENISKGLKQETKEVVKKKTKSKKI